MPYKSESIPIAGTKLDQRRKLSNEQREAVKILADKGYSQRKLAEMFNVSKSLVQSILNPQQRAVQKKRSAAYWAEAKRKYRQRKHQLYKTGKLSEKKTKRHRNNQLVYQSYIAYIWNGQQTRFCGF